MSEGQFWASVRSTSEFQGCGPDDLLSSLNVPLQRLRSTLPRLKSLVREAKIWNEEGSTKIENATGSPALVKKR